MKEGDEDLFVNCAERLITIQVIKEIKSNAEESFWSVRFLNKNRIIKTPMQSQLLWLDLELELTDLIEMCKQKQRSFLHLLLFSVNLTILQTKKAAEVHLHPPLCF